MSELTDSPLWPEGWQADYERLLEIEQLLAWGPLLQPLSDEEEK
jgi:hypothetical protein